MIDSKCSKIMRVFPDLQSAADDRNLVHASAISNAIRRQSFTSGHYFQKWLRCSDEMQQTYLKTNILPEFIASSNGKAVIGTDIAGNERAFSSLRKVELELGCNRAKIIRAIDGGFMEEGYTWKFKD
jgi:hypothetical protein